MVFTILVTEIKCCSEVMKKYFNKIFMMNKKDNKDFKDSKCSICDNAYVDDDV